MSAIYVPLQPTILNPDVLGDAILVCDHASNAEPDGLSLGLSDAERADHIAWDIGVAKLTTEMARLLTVPAILAPVSRLVIDCNRADNHPTLIPAVSDGVVVPANQNITDAEQDARIHAFYDPFHVALDTIVKRHLAAGKRPMLMAVHSFTPILQGQERPWEVGFLWNKDPRLAQAMIGLFERETDMIIGDNEPYSGKELYHTMEVHGERHGLAQTTLEVRNNELNTPGKIKAWAKLLSDFLAECMDRDDLKS